jgi:hypothetical protein
MSGPSQCRSLLLLASGAIVLPMACKNEARHAEPTSKSAASLSRIDVAAFPQNPQVASRILRMPFGEAADRLGSLSFEARSFFVFNRGGEEREQTHIGRLTQDAAGNFYVGIDSGSNQVELYLIGESVYVRQEKGHLRRKPRREAGTESWRDLVWSSIQQTLGMFTPRLRFIDPRPENTAGRPAIRYRIALEPEGENGVELPPIPPGLPAAPASRWRELGRPLAATGNLWLDSATGVVLKLRLEGRLEVSDRDVRPTQLTLRFDGAVSKVGAVTPVVAPDSVPEFERTPPPGDVLGFFRADIAQAGGAAVVPSPATTPSSSSPAAAGGTTPAPAPAPAKQPGQDEQ